MGFFDFMTEDIAIDLGTANTLIIHNDKVVIDSPSIVARDRISGKGMGEMEPKVDCKEACTEEQYSQNRRSEFLIVK